MKHLLIWLGILLITMTLQLVFLPHFLLFQLNIDLILLLVIAFALLQGSKKGLVFGLFAGFICDSFVGRPFGYQILLKGLQGAVVGRLNGMYLENQMGVPLLAALGALSFNELLLHLGYQLFFRGEIWPSFEYWQGTLPALLIKMLIFLLIYSSVRFILRWEKRAGLIKD